MDFEAVIGLEVHAELSTKTKIYCGCSTEFGGKANTHVCPVCLGLPGSLPMLNRRVVEYGIKAGIALNCNITRLSRMDRKNYFYPDCPKNYQITQDELPLCRDGYIDIEREDGVKKRISIERIHIEEDAGKLLHTASGTLVDFNRSGVPLIEIVSRPDISTPEEATLYLQKLKSILNSLAVSDCKMEEGSLRCDGNISIRPKGDLKLGVKSEIKNMNSFKALEKALFYEYDRQVKALDAGEKLLCETRRWDESTLKTFVMRNKEQANDYRYFPEGDQVTINISDEWIEKITSTIPELPHEKCERFIKEFELSPYDSKVLTLSDPLADFFEKTAKLSGDAKTSANLLMGDVSRLMNEASITAERLKFTPEALSELISLIKSGTISNNIGKKVIAEMFITGGTPKTIVEEKGLLQNSDEGEILKIVKEALSDNPALIEDYKNGKTKVVGFLVGLVMKKSKGKSNPQIVNKLILQELTKALN